MTGDVKVNVTAEEAEILCDALYSFRIKCGRDKIPGVCHLLAKVMSQIADQQKSTAFTVQHIKESQ